MLNRAVSLRLVRSSFAGAAAAVLLLTSASVAPAQPLITNAPGYVITWDGNNGDNPNSPSVPTNIARVSQGAIAYASGQLGPQIGAAFHYVTNLNDGFYGNTKSWIGGTNDPTPWFAGIQLPNAVLLTGIAWGRDNTGASQDRSLGTYTLQIATNASFTTNVSDWITVGTITYTNSAVGFSPWLRHRYQLATTTGAQIMATGVRLLVPSSGLATGTDIDELELFRSSVTNIAYWRMGENDPGAANGVTNTVTTNLLGGMLSLRSNAVYSSSVAGTAAARVGSLMALQFTTGRYATNQPAFSFTDNFGLELWVKPDATNAIQCLAYNGDSGPNGWGLYLYQGKYQGLFGSQAFLTGPDAEPGVWTHLALVRNNGLTTLYVNGVPTATSPLPPNTPTGRFALAAQAQSLTAEFFAGSFDEVRVFGFAPGTFSTGDLLLPVLPPIVATAAATSIGGTSATLNGTVQPQNLPTAAWFEWGATTNYGNFTATNTLATTNVLSVLSNTISGLVGGNTYHYRLAASNALGFSYGYDQSFTTVTFNLVPIPGLIGANGDVAWGDYDNDGRLDLLIVGWNSSHLMRNTGNGFTNGPIDLPSFYAGRAAWGDFDNDGYLDFLATGSTPNGDQTGLWRNNGDGTFTNVTVLAPGVPGATRGCVAWGDYDNDGRLDFLITGRNAPTVEYGGVSQLWHNTGNGFTNVTSSAAPGLPPLEDSAMAWGDYDNDGRLDFLLAGKFFPGYFPYINVLQLWHNTGNGFELAPLPPSPEYLYQPNLAWADYDNDGRLDFIYSGSSRFAYVFRNTGNGFQFVTTLQVSSDAGVTTTASWGDFDNDGRLDLLTATAAYVDAPIYDVVPFNKLWRNTTNGFVEVPLAGLANSFVGKTAWGDFDNDGRLDLFTVGTEDVFNSQLWHNNTPVSNAPPTAPTGLAMTATTNAVMLTWNSATDGQTPANGLNYNVRAGTTPGGNNLLAAHVTATNGFRRVPAMGNAYLRHSLPLTGLTNGQTVYWSVQAVDAAFAGGPFASETSYYRGLVTTTADTGPGSLRDAVTNAANSKLITFDPALAGQTITLTSGQLTLSDNVTIDGSDLPGGATIAGDGTNRIFNLSSVAANRTLRGLNLTGGGGRPAPVGSGGAVAVFGSSVTIDRCNLFGNHATNGGAIYNSGGLLLQNSSIFDNTAMQGGAIYNQGSLMLNQCTIARNVANTNGGGVWNTATLPVFQCTITGNTAGRSGGGIYNNAVFVKATNSIIAGNFEAIFNGGIQSPVNCFLSGNPLLAPLAYYGGPTPTMPPLAGSPAIDLGNDAAGSSLTTDQRGQTRLLGAHVDIGAVEGGFSTNFPLVNVTKLGSGNVQFAFTNLSGPSYRVLASTNVAAPINTWSNLGAPTESPAGVFTFVDPHATNYPSRFYRVTTP